MPPIYGTPRDAIERPATPAPTGLQGWAGVGGDWLANGPIGPSPRKKWLRTPIFGPTACRCYECGDLVLVSYFDALRKCAGCGSRRFVPTAV